MSEASNGFHGVHGLTLVDAEGGAYGIIERYDTGFVRSHVAVLPSVLTVFYADNTYLQNNTQGRVA